MKIFAVLFALCLVVNGQIIDTIISTGIANPIGLNQDAQGSLYVCDSFNNRVLRYDNNNFTSPTIVYISAGPTTNPSGVTFDDKGNMVITLVTPVNSPPFGEGEKVLFINTTDLATLRICGADSPAPVNCGPATTIKTPDEIKNDRNLFLYITQFAASQVRRINLTDLSISVFAGTGAVGYTGDGGQAAAATFNTVGGIAFDKNHNVYISDLANNVIRKVDANTGIITTFAGNGTQGNGGNGGQALAATFSSPEPLAFDAFGNLFVGQSFGIRKIAPNGIVTFVNSANLTVGFAGDGGDVSNALFSGVRYIYFDKIGDLLVSDTDAVSNFRVRRIKFANVTCNVNADCEFACFKTTCDVSKVCNFGTLTSLNADGSACSVTSAAQQEETGECLAGQCVNLVPVPPHNGAGALGVSMMLLAIVIALLL